jgi:Cu/Ag efflux protein CusF
MNAYRSPFAHLKLPSDLHSLSPWILAAAFVTASDIVCRHLFALPAELTLLRGCVATTVLLLLAIKRHWSNHRVSFECVGMGALIPGLWLLSPALSPELQVFPWLAGGTVLASYAAWRFVPDYGQSGVLWAWRTGLKRSGVIILPVAIPLILLFGCSRHAASGELAGHELRGEIVRVVPGNHALVVHHDDIPGYMPSMTMEFPVEDRNVGRFKPGQHITARLIEAKPGDLRLKDVRISERAVPQSQARP